MQHRRTTKYNESNIYCVVHGLKPVNLRKKIFNRICYYKSYKECFDNIEEAWEQFYSMDDNYTDKAKSSMEVNKIH